MSITNAAKLPGAFLFFTIKTASGATFAAVAFDENIAKGTTLQSLQAKYLGSGGANLPYMERFADMPTDGTSAWQGKEAISYGMCHVIVP
jgi:hypothetical protein